MKAFNPCTARLPGLAALAVLPLWLGACGPGELSFNADNPARGPSELIDQDQVSDGNFRGGSDTLPEAMPGVSMDAQAASSCDGNCRSYCEAAKLDNPVNRGLCSSIWGLGRASSPIIAEEACRRLWVDTGGTFPTRQELSDECLGRPWGDVVSQRLASDSFVAINRRHWADRLEYDTTAISVERIYDMDRVVASLYRGEIAYDHFAAIVSAHPVLTRRHDTEGDRAEALFWLFLGRPPFGGERSDIARLYHLWSNDYYDHPQLGLRLPDAYIRYRCLDDLGEVNEATSGECTSVGSGFQQLILQPDARATRDNNELKMWSGFLTAEEWEKLQIPGRLISERWLFWEHAANVVLEQYLGYSMASLAPEVGEELVRYALSYNGDARALHYAVLTSAAYLQSTTGTGDPGHRFLHGPLKQIDAEGWVDSVNHLVGGSEDTCDLRLNRPNQFLEEQTPAGIALVDSSSWQLNDDLSGIDRDYMELVQTLGGCPDNSEGGRFKTVSVLTTANQLFYAGRLCDPAGGESGERVDADLLLPKGVNTNTATTGEIAAQIFDHQTRRFFSRPATSDELSRAQAGGEACGRAQCSAEHSHGTFATHS